MQYLRSERRRLKLGNLSGQMGCILRLLLDYVIVHCGPVWSKQIHIRGDRASEHNATASCFGKSIGILYHHNCVHII